MRVRVVRMAQAPSQQICVSFVCEIGRASGQWVGSVPKVDAEYEVEIDIPGVLRWGEQIHATEQLTPALDQREQDTLVTGTLQGFDGEAAEVRLRDDLILIELDRVGCDVPCQVEIQTRDLRLFDINT